MAVVVPNKRQWSGQDIITRAARPMRCSSSLSLDDDFSFGLPPRSPVDSLFLSFLSNVCTHSLSTPGLRLGDVYLPQAISRAAPSSLPRLDRISYSFSPLRRLQTPVLCRFCRKFHRECQGKPSRQLQSRRESRFLHRQLPQVHGSRSQPAVHRFRQWDSKRR